jgi:hypothetical protein
MKQDAELKSCYQRPNLAAMPADHGAVMALQPPLRETADYGNDFACGGVAIRRIIVACAALTALGAALLTVAPLPMTLPPAEAQTLPDPSVPPDRRDPPRARDGNIAVKEEFDAAVSAGTVAALELFIARHPEHPLTSEAKTRLAALRTR